MSAPVYVVLLHHPVVNRHGMEVTTAVTNMDIHDIARSARTYGARGYFLVTPILEQHELVGRILAHWSKDSVREEHPDRAEALSLARLKGTFTEVKQAIQQETGESPEVVLTDARPIGNRVAGHVSYAEFRREWEQSAGRTRPLAIVFGTGWGVSESFYPEVNRVLDPIYGPGGAGGPGGKGGYNHLSVRAAAAVILDRLFGQ